MSNSAFTPTVLTIPATGGGGTGQGELSLITNGSAVTDITGWTNVSRVTSNSPLNPVTPTAFSISNAAAAENFTSGGYASFTLPFGLQNRKLKVEFYYTTPATDVYRVSVYKGSTRVALSTDSSNVTTLPANTTGKFVAYFDTDTSASWSLNVTRTSGTTGPCYITNVVCGPGIQPQGAVVEEWETFNFTVSNITNVTAGNGRRRRVGSELEIEMVVKGTATAALTASTVLFSNFLPAGTTLNTSLFTGLQSVTSRGNFLSGSAFFPNANASYSAGYTNAALEYDSAANNWRVVAQITPKDTSTTGLGPTFASLSTTGTFFPSNALGSTDGYINVKGMIPIAEWAGSGTVQLAQNDVEYAYNTTTTTTTETTGFGYGPAGIGFQAFAPTGTGSVDKRVRFQTPIQSSDVITVEIMDPTTNFWAPAASRFFGVFSANDAGTTFYGIDINDVSGSSTDLDVRFFSKTGNKAQAWSDLVAPGWKWRVRKSSAGAAVGFGIVRGSSAGLLPSSNSNLDDATATRLGLKQYLHGTTYNGGIAPTVTLGGGGTLSSVDLASFVPYQVQDGSWKLKFNIAVTVSSATRTFALFSVAGIFTTTIQAVYGFSSVIPLTASSYASGGSVQINHASATTTNYYFSGEITLSSKPTWAY